MRQVCIYEWPRTRSGLSNPMGLNCLHQARVVDAGADSVGPDRWIGLPRQVVAAAEDQPAYRQQRVDGGEQQPKSCRRPR